MSELISRQAAIDLLKQMRKDGDMIPWEGKDVFARIRKLPSAQPEQRWIPCSEETGDGYPEKDGFYYVTEQNYGFYLDADCKQRVTHTSHFKNGNFTDRFYAENNSNITAWMPLPEPYKDDPCNECDYLGESCVGEGCGKLTERKEGEADD